MIDNFIFILIGVLNGINLSHFGSFTALVVLTTAMIIYKPSFEYLFGGTFGKLLLDLRVVNKEVRKISLIDSSVRSLVFCLPWAISALPNFQVIAHPDYHAGMGNSYATLMSIETIPFIPNLVFGGLCLLSVVWVIFHRNNRGLHDLLAGTYCVKLDTRNQPDPNRLVKENFS